MFSSGEWVSFARVWVWIISSRSSVFSNGRRTFQRTLEKREKREKRTLDPSLDIGKDVRKREQLHSDPIMSTQFRQGQTRIEQGKCGHTGRRALSQPKREERTRALDLVLQLFRLTS